VFLVDESTDRGYVSETWAAAAKRTGGGSEDGFEFVSELPFDGAVSERIIGAFSNGSPGDMR
jgi:hypothetical protein